MTTPVPEPLVTAGPVSKFNGEAARIDQIVTNQPQMAYEGVPFFLGRVESTGVWEPMPCSNFVQVVNPPPPTFETLEEAWQWVLLVCTEG